MGIGEQAAQFVLERAGTDNHQAGILKVRQGLQVGNLLDTPLRTYNDNKEHRLGRLDYYGRRFLFDVTVRY